MSIELHIRHGLEGFQLCCDYESGCKRIGILGASGCGKSMTLKSIAGIVKPESGRIIVDGRTLFDSEKKINVTPQKRKIGYLFQNYALFPSMTVEKNIGAGLQGIGKEECRRRVGEMTDRFALKGYEHRYPHELSGGQQQRVALARIMAYEPELIMLDEPFSALDSFLKDNLKREMKSLLADYKGTMVMVSHSRDEVYEFAEQLIVMGKGRMLETGNTRKVFAKPLCRETARLTGCKNISAIEKIGEYQVRALDWGIELKTEEPVAEEHRYIGFRAHDILPGWEGEVNAFRYEVQDEMEAPFEVVYLIRAEGKEDIWWKVSRIQQKNPFDGQMPSCVKIPVESLFLLRDS